jgi:hypothetical protein
MCVDPECMYIHTMYIFSGMHIRYEYAIDFIHRYISSSHRHTYIVPSPKCEVGETSALGPLIGQVSLIGIVALAMVALSVTICGSRLLWRRFHWTELLSTNSFVTTGTTTGVDGQGDHGGFFQQCDPN